ncbi:Glycosyltransferase involved in cell wall bisynthesis [Solimonas aquatica]|uniref:Glycosyltransferase involved in cell wall bisynthesis n=1 Tax=Solimonas aquatica TaxID=489703 RepID=A0A1H9BVH6_9GAMM|nr:glycosyltransferase [Solimonas aquatica]SEP92879.1 Glycosyltransferase involved in cell wall bisynthesis [Solimonas aquatica]
MSLAYFSLVQPAISRVRLDSVKINRDTGEINASIGVISNRPARALSIRSVAAVDLGELKARRVAGDRFVVSGKLFEPGQQVDAIQVRLLTWERRKQLLVVRLPKNVLESGAIEQISICSFDGTVEVAGRFDRVFRHQELMVTLDHIPLAGHVICDESGGWKFSGRLATCAEGAWFDVSLSEGTELAVTARLPDGSHHRVAQVPSGEQVTHAIGAICAVEAERSGKRLYVRGHFLARDRRGRILLEMNGERLPRAAKRIAAPWLSAAELACLDDERPGWEWAGDTEADLEGAMLQATLELDGKQIAKVSTVIRPEHMVDTVGHDNLYFDSPYRPAFLELLEEKHDPLEPTITFIFPGDLSSVMGGGPSRVVSMAQYLKSMGYQVLSIERVRPDSLPNPELVQRMDELFTRRWRLSDEMLADFAALATDELESEAAAGPEAQKILMALQADEQAASDSLIGSRTNPRFNALAAYFISRHSPECVIANFAWTAPVFDLLPDSIFRVLDTHDLQFKRAEMISTAIGGDAYRADIDEEREHLLKADIVLAIQPEEKDAIIDLTGRNNVVLTSHGVDIQDLSAGEADSKVVLFIGNRYEPNILGLQNFLATTWPLILEQVPEARLEVVGAVVEAISEWPQGVMPLGRVPELEVYYRLAAVVINPVEIGSGLNIKTVEALAFGKALVSTGFGMKGLPVDPAAEGAAIRADVGADMAKAVVDLLQAPELRQALEQSALGFARRHLSPQATFNELKNTLELRLF